MLACLWSVLSNCVGQLECAHYSGTETAINLADVARARKREERKLCITRNSHRV